MPRVPHGEQHPGAKLTQEQARAIRASAEPPTALARRYSVSKTTIGDIRAGRSWAQLDETDRDMYLRPFVAPGLLPETLAIRLLDGRLAIIDAADADRVAGRYCSSP